MRRAITAAVVLLATSALLSAAMAAAGAAVAPDRLAAARATRAAPPNAVYMGDYTMSNEAASRCLDADTTMGGVDGNKVQIWDCNNQGQQDWQFWETSSGSGVYYIVNAKYQKCLDMDLNTFPSDGTRVQLWDCNYQKQQLWYLPFFDTSSRTIGWHQFYANAATRYVLDADNSHGLINGSKAQLWENLSGANQFWHVWPFG